MEAHVINMTNAPERWESWCSRWNAIVPGKRVDAIRHKNGHIGCSLSHVKAIREGFESDQNVLLVMEDDAIPVDVTAEFLETLREELTASWESWSVACLSTTNYEPYDIPVGIDVGSEHFMKLKKTDVTSLVASHITIYSRSILKHIDAYEAMLRDGIIIPIDRFQFKATWGPYTLPTFTPLLLNRTLAKQDPVKMSYDDIESAGARDIATAWKYKIQDVSTTPTTAPTPTTPPTDTIHSDVTVVTGLFPIKSKVSLSFYLNKCKAFLQHVCAPVVLFTTPELKKQLQALRSFPLQIVDTVPAGWKHTSLFSDKEWQDQSKRARNISGKNITAELFQLYFQKTDFVHYVIHELGVKSKYYVWADIGSFRNDLWLPYLESWPSVAKLRLALNTREMCFQQRRIPTANPETSEDSLILNSVVAGAILAGTERGWNLMSELLPKEVCYLRDFNIIWGCDETVHWSLLRRYPSVFTSYFTGDLRDFEEATWFGGYHVLSEISIPSWNTLGNHFVYSGSNGPLQNKLEDICSNALIPFTTGNEDTVLELLERGAKRVLYNTCETFLVKPTFPINAFCLTKYPQIKTEYLCAKTRNPTALSFRHSIHKYIIDTNIPHPALVYIVTLVRSHYEAAVAAFQGKEWAKVVYASTTPYFESGYIMNAAALYERDNWKKRNYVGFYYWKSDTPLKSVVDSMETAIEEVEEKDVDACFFHPILTPNSMGGTDVLKYNHFKDIWDSLCTKIPSLSQPFYGSISSWIARPEIVRDLGVWLRTECGPRVLAHPAAREDSGLKLPISDEMQKTGLSFIPTMALLLNRAQAGYLYCIASNLTYWNPLKKETYTTV